MLSSFFEKKKRFPLKPGYFLDTANADGFAVFAHPGHSYQAPAGAKRCYPCHKDGSYSCSRLFPPRKQYEQDKHTYSETDSSEWKSATENGFEFSD